MAYVMIGQSYTEIRRVFIFFGFPKFSHPTQSRSFGKSKVEENERDRFGP